MPEGLKEEKRGGGRKNNQQTYGRFNNTPRKKEIDEQVSIQPSRRTSLLSSFLYEHEFL